MVIDVDLSAWGMHRIGGDRIPEPEDRLGTSDPRKRKLRPQCEEDEPKATDVVYEEGFMFAKTADGRVYEKPMSR